MRFFALFRKTTIENLRDWKILAVALLFGPLFVVLMFGYYSSAPLTYDIIFVNQDTYATLTNGTQISASQGLMSAMTNITYEDGAQILHIRQESNLDSAKKEISQRSADLAVLIPPEFSQSLVSYTTGQNASLPIVRTFGDPANPDYVMAAVYNDMNLYDYTVSFTGFKQPVAINPEVVTVNNGLGSRESQSSFDLIVPSLLMLPLMMLLFTAAASVIREKDDKTIVRLQMSGIRSAEYVGAITLTQVLIGVVAMGLTLLTAILLGYNPASLNIDIIVIGVLASLGIIAISLIMASFLRSLFDLMTIGVFPFFLLMFFSGGMFPLPTAEILNIGGHVVKINDVLPTTLATSAIDKIMNNGLGLADLGYEITLLFLFTAMYMFIGVALLRWRYLKPR